MAKALDPRPATHGVTLLDVITRSSQVQHGRVVRVDEPHLETVTDDLQLARVGSSLQSDGVDKATDGTVLVFPETQHSMRQRRSRCASRRTQLDLPGGAGHPGDPQLLGNLALINGHTAELTGLLVPLDRMSLNRVDVDISTEVSGQVCRVAQGDQNRCVHCRQLLARWLLTTEVSTLLDDGTHVDSLVPPSGLGNSLVSTSLSITIPYHQPVT